MSFTSPRTLSASAPLSSLTSVPPLETNLKNFCPCDTTVIQSKRYTSPVLDKPIFKSDLQVGNFFLACISHTIVWSRYRVDANVSR